MKKTQLSEVQIVKILREADRAAVGDVARKHGMTEAAIYALRRKFGELGPEDVKRLRHLKIEHARRQRLGAKPGN